MLEVEAPSAKIAQKRSLTREAKLVQRSFDFTDTPFEEDVILL